MKWKTDIKIQIMRFTELILLILLVNIIKPAIAQNQITWSLNECIHYALEHNLKQQQYLLNEQSSRVEAQQAKFNLLPTVSASSSAGLNLGRSIDEYTNDIVNTEYFNNSNSLSSRMTLFQGFIQQNRIAYAKFRLEAARWQKINQEDDLAFSILTAYYDVIYYKGLVGIAREQLDLSEQNLRKMEALIETGLKAKTDLAEMQATYEKEKLNLIQSENKLEEVKLRLGQEMNLPAGRLGSLQINTREAVVTSDLSVAADSLYESFVAHSPYVKIAEAELLASAKEVAITRGQFFPSIYLNASMNTGYYETYRDEDGRTISFSDQFDNNMSHYVGASISIPIFQKNQIRSQFRQAKLGKQQAKIQADIYKQAVYYELLNNSRELQALFSEYIQTEKQVEADELAYRVAQRKYDEGIIDVIELLSVKNRLTEAKSQQLSAQLQWEIKVRIVDFYKGVRFWE